MEKLPTSGSTYGATRAWLACVGACAAKQDAVNAKKTAREVAAEMIESKLATQTTRPVFELGFAGPRR